MRLLSFSISLIITVALVIALNNSIGSIPPIGKFVSPQQGFWQNAEPVHKNFNADFSFPQLKNKSRVFFDERLVPHVFAEDENDAYFIEGYLHAKFRLWQMEFQTFAAAGRLTEVLGAGPDSAYLNNDKFMRRLGMVYGAKRSIAEMEKDPTTRNELNSYTAGVNSYIESLTVAELPLEYKLLNYVPEKWTNLKSSLLLKYMSYDLTGFDNDIEHTNAKSFFSAEDYNKLYPLFPDSLDPIIPKGSMFEAPSIIPAVPYNADSAYFMNVKDSVYVSPLKPERINGSNNWVVSGKKTKSGRPILCNDPHLGLSLPSLWYEMQISTPSKNVYGVSIPGSPSIVVGFNDSIAWGLTNAARDVKDYYRIQFKDDNKTSYWFNNEWKAADMVIETYFLKDGTKLYDTVSYTVFGPVLYDNNYNGKGRVPKNENLALRWTAHDPSNELKTFSLLNSAKNYSDYQKALTFYTCPGQNIAFASKSGDIALWQAGKFPAKWTHQGDLIMPGTDNSYAWQGSVPQSENPHLINPERGFVSSANQLPADSTYPYYLGGEYDVYRGITINHFLSGLNEIVPADMQKMQNQNYNAFAEMAVPLLLAHIRESDLTDTEKSYLQMVKTWNLRNDNEETGVTVFVNWFQQFENTVWDDELAQVKGSVTKPEPSTLIEAILKDSTFSFLDNINTTEKESLVDDITLAFKKAVPLLESANSDGKLKWNKYKDTGIRHLLRIEALSRYHLNTGGGIHVINATTQFHGPSWRMVVQLTDKTEAYGIYPGGQSGNPG
ncbi:MAG: penicillin acylase family protein, partial [Flavitalea sp.]